MILDNNIECMKENKYFLAILIIIINFGARFIVEELTPDQKKMINHTYFRRIVLFSIVFMATKDFLISITVTILSVFIIHEFSLFENQETNNEKEENNTKEEIIKNIHNDIDGILRKYIH